MNVLNISIIIVISYDDFTMIELQNSFVRRILLKKKKCANSWFLTNILM